VPTTRKHRTRAPLVVTSAVAEHLETGPDHLLATAPSGPFSCWVCRYGIAMARTAWATHGAKIKADWSRRFPYPCFAQCALDGERMPAAMDPGWTVLQQQVYDMIVEALLARAK